MKLVQWTLLLPTIALTLVLVGCSSDEPEVLPLDESMQVDESYEEDSYDSSSDPSAN